MKQIPVSLLDQLIGIGINFTEFGVELDRIPLFDRMLYRAS